MISIATMLTADEGLRARVYTDTVGKKTVGVGFNMDDSNAQNVWIQADIPESFKLVYNGQYPLSTKSIGNLLNTCVANCKIDLVSLFSAFDTYPDYVQLALINLMFNMGKTTLSQFVTTISLIKQGKYNDAADHLKSTKWASQLPERSQRVMALLKGDDTLYKAFGNNAASNGPQIQY